jgi:glyoxylase-like metal-dependent hydrolase (beta-lactamase superfamily II)
MKELLSWIEKNLPKRRLLAVNTHFHSDRSGGNALLKEKKIPVYASDLTVKLMKSRGRAVMEGVAGAIADEAARAAFLSAPVVPAEGVFALATGLKLTVGGEPFEVRFHGAGHTPDNVVVWFPARKLLYAGCLALSSDRVGNTSDADLKAWPQSVEALKAYGATRVIPGHGSSFEPAVLERTAAALAKRSSAD